jgi:transposase-like protein
MSRQKLRPKKAAVLPVLDPFADPDTETEPTAAETVTAVVVKRPRSNQPKYDPDNARIAAIVCKRGATISELMELFEVSQRTIHNWKYAYPEFGRALKVGWKAALERVERSLYERAVGYTATTERVFKNKGEDPVIVETTEVYPPDVQAAELLLVNKDPEHWKRRNAGLGADGTGISLEVLIRGSYQPRVGEIIDATPAPALPAPEKDER